MNKISLFETLISKGWMEETGPSFAERAGKGATHYFTYKNKRGNILTLAVFTETASIRFRVFDPNTREVSWLEIGMDNSVEKVISKIAESQEEITQAEAFGFYFNISSLGNVAFLAWEQYEEDYE